MFGSEVLDAAAIGAASALLGGIFAGIFNLLMKRTESKIKALELTYKERMKAFSDIIAAISDANNRIHAMYRLLGKYDHETVFILSGVDPSGLDIDEITTMFSDCKRDFVKVYDNNRLYLPIDIDKKVKRYIEENLDLPLPSFVETNDVGRYEIDYVSTKKDFDTYLAKIKPTNDERLESIILEVQRFIGFK